MFKKFLQLFKRRPVTIREHCVESMRDIVKDYSDWYEERGLYLPPDFATRPDEWNEELHKMVYAFNEVDNKFEDEDVKKIKEGFESFGKYLYFLNDPKKENK